MPLVLDDKEKDEKEPEVEQPDHAAPLRADVMGSIAGANPNSPGYLGKINNLITAHGALEKMNPFAGKGSGVMDAASDNERPAKLDVPSGLMSSAPSPVADTAKMAQPQPHRGLLGRIGHVLGRMGNIAGDILAPGVMEAIPGTDMNKRFESAVKDRNAARDRELGIRETTANAEKLKAETGAKLEPSEEDKNLAEAFKARLSPEAKTDFEAWQKQNPNAPVSDWLKLLADNKPGKEPSKDDKDIADYIASNNLADTPANREKARDAIAKRNPTAHVQVEGTGNWMPTYDDKGHVTGSWNPKTGEVKQAPANIAGTTAQGSGIGTKADAATEKKLAPLKSALAEVETARDLKEAADKGNAEADVGLTLAFFKVMRGATGPGGAGGGIRFTQQEQSLIMGAKNLWGSLQVAGNKVLSNGEPLSSDQRKQIMDVIELYGKAAQRSLDEAQGGATKAGGAITYKEGADVYDIPPDKVAAFEKAHPNAKKQ